MHPLDDDPHETTERDPGPDRAALRPLRLFQTVTAVTGALSAAGVGGVLALQSTPGYARAVLEARSWGASEVTDADVALLLGNERPSASAVPSSLPARSPPTGRSSSTRGPSPRTAPRPDGRLGS